MLTAALLTIAKTWKQLKCPLTVEQIKKLWYIYNRILCSHKKNQIMPFAATWVDPEILMKSVRLRKINITPYNLCVESKKKKIQINLFIKKTHRHGKQTDGYQRGKGVKLGVTNKDLLYAQGSILNIL